MAEEVKEEKVAKKPAVKKSAAKKVIAPVVAGGRKEAVARVKLTQGNGKFTINKRDIDEYFKLETVKMIAKQPLTLTKTLGKYDVSVNVTGGGYAGQAGAIRQAISKALVKENEGLKAELKAAGFLTRDSKIKERKKYGLKKARKAPQFSKR